MLSLKTSEELEWGDSGLDSGLCTTCKLRFCVGVVQVLVIVLVLALVALEILVDVAVVALVVLVILGDVVEVGISLDEGG